MSKVLAMDPNVVLIWVPKCEKDSPQSEQFRLKYKNLSAREEAMIADAQISSKTEGKKSTYEYRVSTADLRRCELSIVGWENFNMPPDHPDHPNQPVPFSKDNIGMIPANIRSEFVNFITRREEEEKKEDPLGEAKTE